MHFRRLHCAKWRLRRMWLISQYFLRRMNCQGTSLAKYSGSLVGKKAASFSTKPTFHLILIHKSKAVLTKLKRHALLQIVAIGMNPAVLVLRIAALASFERAMDFGGFGTSAQMRATGIRP